MPLSSGTDSTRHLLVGLSSLAIGGLGAEGVWVGFVGVGGWRFWPIAFMMIEDREEERSSVIFFFGRGRGGGVGSMAGTTSVGIEEFVVDWVPL
jgi:hypothetical protein